MIDILSKGRTKTFYFKLDMPEISANDQHLAATKIGADSVEEAKIFLDKFYRHVFSCSPVNLTEIDEKEFNQIKGLTTQVERRSLYTEEERKALGKKYNNMKRKDKTNVRQCDD